MRPFLLALVLVLPNLALSANTNSIFARWAEQTYMLGDWGGARPWLSSHGADFEFLYLGSLPSNLGGGIKTGSEYQGAIAAMLDLDSQKLLGYEGGTFHVSGIWLHGREHFSANYSGDYNRVNLVDFDNALRLWEIYYRQKFFDGKFSAKVGRLSIDSDFILPEYFTSFGQFSFVNQTFAFPTLPFNVFTPPGFPATAHGISTMPLATPGAVLAWNPAPEFTVQAGAFSGSPDQSYSGSRWPISQQDGALNYLEVAWRHNPGTNNSHLGGTVKVGGYYHTSEFTDTYEGVYFAAGLNPTPRQHTGNYGGYLMAEHQLYLENGKADPAQQGLIGFFRALAAPSDRNLTQLELDAGLVYRGLIPSRDWDSFAVAFSYLGLSEDIRRAQQEINGLAPGSFTPVDYEDVVEASYRAQLTAWWTLQGSYQHVFHPGGSSALPDADVFILQTTLRF